MATPLSHTQYDGIGLPVLIHDLLGSYHGAVLQNFQISYGISTLSEPPPQPTGETSFEAPRAKVPQILQSESWSTTLQSTPVKIMVEKPVSLPNLPQGITLASVIGSAWAIVLSGVTGCGDVVFGSLVSGRDTSKPGIDRVLSRVSISFR